MTGEYLMSLGTAAVGASAILTARDYKIKKHIDSLYSELIKNAESIESVLMLKKKELLDQYPRGGVLTYLTKRHWRKELDKRIEERDDKRFDRTHKTKPNTDLKFLIGEPEKIIQE